MLIEAKVQAGVSADQLRRHAAFAGAGWRVGTKHQPEWTHALYQVLVNKRSNIQLGLETHFQYECPVVRSPEVVELFAEAWIAMVPLAGLAMHRSDVTRESSDAAC